VPRTDVTSARRAAPKTPGRDCPRGLASFETETECARERPFANCTRLGQLLKLAISTDQDGEALNALAAVRRTLAAVDLDLHDVEIGLSKPPTTVDESDWRRLARSCNDRDDLLGPTARAQHRSRHQLAMHLSLSQEIHLCRGQS
jgi:hypothetical protein